MAEYTIYIQERPVDMMLPVRAHADSVDSAIEAAAERLASHGEIHRVDVYPGHDGWYALSERLWTGSLEWSQIDAADWRLIPDKPKHAEQGQCPTTCFGRGHCL